jgi:hypothetical protein
MCELETAAINNTIHNTQGTNRNKKKKKKNKKKKQKKKGERMPRQAASQPNTTTRQKQRRLTGRRRGRRKGIDRVLRARTARCFAQRCPDVEVRNLALELGAAGIAPVVAAAVDDREVTVLGRALVVVGRSAPRALVARAAVTDADTPIRVVAVVVARIATIIVVVVVVVVVVVAIIDVDGGVAEALRRVVPRAEPVVLVARDGLDGPEPLRVARRHALESLGHGVDVAGNLLHRDREVVEHLGARLPRVRDAQGAFGRAETLHGVVHPSSHPRKFSRCNASRAGAVAATARAKDRQHKTQMQKIQKTQCCFCFFLNVSARG